MFLKNLKIYGFKTFGRKVVVDFQKGITAIVGPNGAGKSNLIDALNWVTGETRLSDLRVRTSEQLIFHGSPSLKPLSLAEVSLTIENTDNLLPIEYAEVNITRRIYRDGTSEFFINKNKCILKDITNLFLGTGAGRGAYASMRQGEIDRILKQKPEERREIFEEAAGILKYRNKRRETERDLERAESNLKQIRPTLLEVERLYHAKKKQAEKAERYNKLMDRRIAVEVDIHLVKVFDLKRELESKNEVLQKQLDKKQTLLDKLKTIEMDIDASLAQSQDLQQNQHSTQTEILKHETEISALRQRIASLGDRKMALELNIKEWDAALLQSDQRLAKIDSILEDLAKEKSNLAGMIAERQDNLEQYARDITAIQKIVDDDTANIAAYHKKIADLDIALAESRQRLEEVINRMVEAIDKRKAELKGSAELKQDLKTSIARALDELGVFLKGRKDVLSDLASLDITRHSDKEKVKSTLAALRDSFEQRLASVEHLRQQFSQLDNLISGFDEIIFAREGIHAQKESLDKAIGDMQRDEKAHKERIVFLETDIRNQQARIETIKQMMHDSQLALVQMREKSRAVEESMKTQQGFRRDVEKQREGVAASIRQARETIAGIDTESAGLVKDQVRVVTSQDKLKADLARISKNLSSITQASSGKEKKARECKEQLEEFHARIEEATRSITTIEVEMRTIYENFYENYSIDLKEHEKEIRNRKFDVGELRTE
ncbi:MAG TPA: AAA family ATPase, partial [Spirochaetota bacterium]|nr:AAA family ATPase [Spirochaetota bacterium]